MKMVLPRLTNNTKKGNKEDNGKYNLHAILIPMKKGQEKKWQMIFNRK